MSTLSEHITAVETLLSQTAGVSVQKYAEPRIAQFIQRAFDVLFVEEWWGQFRTWDTRTLDGATGVVTVVPTIKSWKDIRAVYPSTQQRRLSRLPFPFNPFLMTGTDPTYLEPQAGTKLFRIWPLLSVGSIYIQGRLKPANFDLDDDIDFDDLCLQSLAAWEYSVDDGNNPAQAQKLQAMYERRLIQLKADELGNVPTDMDARFGSVPNQWQEWP